MEQNAKELFVAIGEIRGDVKSLLTIQLDHTNRTTKLEERVTALEKWPTRLLSAASLGTIVLYLYGERIIEALAKLGL